MTGVNLESNGKIATEARSGWEFDWQERRQPVKFDFADGVQLIGILLNVERMMLRDKRSNQSKAANRYTVQPILRDCSPDGDAVFFFGTVQLDNVLRIGDIGHPISVLCTGTDANAGRQGNPMKLFKVYVDSRTAPGWVHDGTQISDADLPDEAFIA